MQTLLWWLWFSSWFLYTFLMPRTPKLPPSDEGKIISEKDVEHLEHLVNAIQALGLEEFIEYIQSPWKLLWPNFIAGVARWFGALVGAAIVIWVIWWVLSSLIDLPLIGKRLEPYVQNVQSELKQYTEATNYRPYFESMNQTLRKIETNTQPWLLK